MAQWEMRYYAGRMWWKDQYGPVTMLTLKPGAGDSLTIPWKRIPGLWDWEEPREVSLGLWGEDEVVLLVSPYGEWDGAEEQRWRRGVVRRPPPPRRQWAGTVTAFVRRGPGRWGIPMDDARVAEGLEALGGLWTMGRGGVER